MVSKEVIDYIKDQLQKGQNSAEIRNALIAAGWQAVDIDEAFRYAEQNIPNESMPINSSRSYQLGQGNQNASILASPTDLLKEAWKIYKARFKTFIGISLIPIFVIVILVIILVIFAVLAGSAGGFSNIISPSAHAIVNSPSAPNPEFVPTQTMAISNIINFILGFGISLFVFFIPLIIMQIWGQAAMLFAVKDSEENIGIKEAYRRGWHKIGSVFWVGLLSGIIVFGGYLLLVIPGIIFGVWFTFAVMIAVAENLGGMNAILKSKFYVSGYWWEVLWRLIFISLIIGGISFVFSLPAWVINFIAGFTKSDPLSLIGSVLNILSGIVGIFLAPLTVIYTFLIYKNLKAIKGEKTPIFSGGEKSKFILAGILGILLFAGMISIPILLINSSMKNAKVKAQDAARQADISQLRISLETYAIDHDDKYPETLNQLLGEEGGDEILSSIPVDPKTKLPYEYKLLDNGNDYELCAKLDAGRRKCLNRY